MRPPMSESANDRYERLAMEFWNRYGYAPPGKDSRTPIPVSEDERLKTWLEFRKEAAERETADDD